MKKLFSISMLILISNLFGIYQYNQTIELNNNEDKLLLINNYLFILSENGLSINEWADNEMTEIESYTEINGTLMYYNNPFLYIKDSNTINIYLVEDSSLTYYDYFDTGNLGYSDFVVQGDTFVLVYPYVEYEEDGSPDYFHTLKFFQITAEHSISLRNQYNNNNCSSDISLTINSDNYLYCNERFYDCNSYIVETVNNPYSYIYYLNKNYLIERTFDNNTVEIYEYQGSGIEYELITSITPIGNESPLRHIDISNNILYLTYRRSYKAVIERYTLTGDFLSSYAIPKSMNLDVYDFGDTFAFKIDDEMQVISNNSEDLDINWILKDMNNARFSKVINNELYYLKDGYLKIYDLSSNQIIAEYFLNLRHMNFNDYDEYFFLDETYFVLRSNNNWYVVYYQSGENPPFIKEISVGYNFGRQVPVTIVDEKILFIYGGTLTVVDFGLDEPEIIAEFSVVGNDFYVDGNIIYFVSPYNTVPSNLSIVDISDVSNPQLISQIDLDTCSIIGKKDNYLYLYSNDKLQIVDVADNENPVLVNEFDGSYPYSYYSRESGMLDDKFYLVDDYQNRIDFYDLVEPEQPEFIKSFYWNYYIKEIYQYEDQILIPAYEGLISLSEQITPLEENHIELLSESMLSNYPNPFNPATNISFNILKNSKVSVDIYNIKGQKVKTLIDENMSAGNHQIEWHGKNQNGNSVSSGVYFYKLNIDNKHEITKKMLLLK